MLKLVNDFIQFSDAADALKSPDLSDVYYFMNATITLDQTREIDCIGIGYTDATTITVNGEAITYDENGLYELQTTLNTDTLTVSHDGMFIGRLAAGKKRSLGSAPTREPGFYSTHVPRTTVAGNVVPGAGGITGKRIGVDFRYKIDEDIYQDFVDAYPTQVGKGFPFFLYFDKEQHRMPYKRLYAATDNELLFQSSVNRFLYSRRFDYSERF